MPDDAYTLGLAATSILACPFKGECRLARRWVDGWYDAFIKRREDKKEP